MPKTNYSNKPVRSFRISQEGVRQLKALASNMERGESDVIEVALDRMYREEIRFGQLIREGQNPEDNYQVTETEKE